MALDAGDAVKGTGLAGLISKYRKEAYGPSYSVSKDASGVNALAKAIVEHITGAAEVEVTEAPLGNVLTPPGIGTVK